jgi:hypothetical protein
MPDAVETEFYGLQARAAIWQLEQGDEEQCDFNHRLNFLSLVNYPACESGILIMAHVRDIPYMVARVGPDSRPLALCRRRSLNSAIRSAQELAPTSRYPVGIWCEVAQAWQYASFLPGMRVLGGRGLVPVRLTSI